MHLRSFALPAIVPEVRLGRSLRFHSTSRSPFLRQRFLGHHQRPRQPCRTPAWTKILL